MIFLNNKLAKFRIFIGWPRNSIPSWNFYEASRFVHP